MCCFIMHVMEYKITKDYLQLCYRYLLHPFAERWRTDKYLLPRQRMLGGKHRTGLDTSIYHLDGTVIYEWHDVDFDLVVYSTSYYFNESFPLHLPCSTLTQKHAYKTVEASLKAYQCLESDISPNRGDQFTWRVFGQGQSKNCVQPTCIFHNVLRSKKNQWDTRSAPSQRPWRVVWRRHQSQPLGMNGMRRCHI